MLQTLNNPKLFLTCNISLYEGAWSSKQAGKGSLGAL